MGDQDDKAAWSDLAERLRALGGVVDNIRLGRGTRGRGLFVERRGEPSRLVLPPHMLIPESDVEVQSGQLVVKSDAQVSSEVRAFFADYHASIGFARDIHRDARRAITGKHELPKALQDMILKGHPDGLAQFPAFKDDSVLPWFIDTRCIGHKGGRVLMPMVELTNHDASAQGFGTTGGGVSIEDTFENEVLVRYHAGDPWTVYLRWGFAAPSDRVYALGGELTEPAGWRIRIRAETRPTERVQHTSVSAKDRVLTIDRMLLIGPEGADAARTLFRSQMSRYGVADSDELFSLVVKINKDWFIRALAMTKGGVAKSGLKDFRAAVKLQLKALEGLHSG